MAHQSVSTRKVSIRRRRGTARAMCKSSSADPPFRKRVDALRALIVSVATSYLQAHHALLFSAVHRCELTKALIKSNSG
ncbi:MAG: hypothetical protein AVDCRST_MAG93-7549 [uncultured Chloroflexia bacterium]|uniref:Uncharacterized protein n=1 Tax=uncultured Chloroflexia bacterium TaxID=1672391 RepID=A0A6J4MJ33_9CHLR|nr:MAG: hypothetical protein AVDCRST_MAG93-7549 [uncultured Chloroflexia bacterium]